MANSNKRSYEEFKYIKAILNDDDIRKILKEPLAKHFTEIKMMEISKNPDLFFDEFQKINDESKYEDFIAVSKDISDWIPKLLSDDEDAVKSRTLFKVNYALLHVQPDEIVNNLPMSEVFLHDCWHSDILTDNIRDKLIAVYTQKGSTSAKYQFLWDVNLKSTNCYGKLLVLLHKYKTNYISKYCEDLPKLIDDTREEDVENLIMGWAASILEHNMNLKYLEPVDSNVGNIESDATPVTTTNKDNELSYIEREQYLKIKKDHDYIRPGEISFVIDGIRDKMNRMNEVIHSPYFYSHENGYKVRLKVYPGSDNNEYEAVCYKIQICKSDNDDNLEWPCRHSFDIAIVNIQNNRIHHTNSHSYDNDINDRKSYNKPISKYNKGIGHDPLIIHLDLLYNVGIIVNDCIVIKCVIRPPINIDTKYRNGISETMVTVNNISDRMNYINSRIDSPYFYSHKNGYKVRLKVCPGDYYGSDMGVFIQICKSDNDDNLSWPCRHSFDISIVNIQNNIHTIHNTISYSYDNDDARYSICYDKPISEYNNIVILFSSLISHSNLRSIDGIIVNDCIIFKCVITPPSS